MFTTAVVDLAVQLVEDANATSLLAPLRHLARRDTSIGRRVVAAELTTLHRGPNVEAGSCVNELRSHVRLEDFDEPVVHSLVVVAGGPTIDFLGRHRRNTAADPGGLPGGHHRSIVAVGGGQSRLVEALGAQPRLVLDRPSRPIPPHPAVAQQELGQPVTGPGQILATMSPRVRHRSRTASSRGLGTRIAVSSPARDNRANGGNRACPS